MPNTTFHYLIGLRGVAADERPAARTWASRFELPMILLAMWIVVEWYLVARGVYPDLLIRFTDWLIWLFFLLETMLLTLLVRDRRRYLLGNWMNLLIIVLGTPLLWGGGSYAAMLRHARENPSWARGMLRLWLAVFRTLPRGR